MIPALHFRFAARVPGLAALTTTRSHNLGLNTPEDPAAVLANRGELWAQLGLRLQDSVFLRQVHGDGLQVVGREARGRGISSWEDGLADCDIAVAREPGLLLCIGHADCLALLVADPVTRLCGAAHAGWRGASLHVAAKLVRAMAELGCEPSRLLAGLSVCLGPCHLELGGEIYPAFEGSAGRGTLEGGRFFLDLRAHVRQELLDCGVLGANIEAQEACTWDDNARFFSHRAEKGRSGRQMSLIGFVS